MTLDVNNTNIAYNIGRLIAVSERIAEGISAPTYRILEGKEIAKHGPMNGVALALEPTLMNLSRLQDSDKELADKLDKEMLTITDHLPADLDQVQLKEPDWDLMTLGYSHQRAVAM